MIKIISKGLYTTIQDEGRFGYRDIGVPSSGYMDKESAQIANLILDNPINNPLIEATLIGPTIKFEKPTVICITGSDFNPMLNENRISLYTAVKVKKGDKLKINNSSIGSRCYISIKGDIKLDEVLGSKSYYPQISHSSIIEKGDEFKFETNNSEPNYKLINQKFELNKNLKVFKGPEFNSLNKGSINKIIDQEFSIGINNRMAYNLKEKIQAGTTSIISSPVIPGTVQLTPSGQMIILHRDCQTTGGYARILQLDEKSLNNLAQLRIGDKIKFEIVTL